MKVKRETIILASLSVLSIVFVLSCEDDDWGDVSYSVAGIVTDSVTLLPIDSAELAVGDSLSPVQTYTDSLGIYRLTTFAGKTRMWVRKTGYYSRFKDINLNRNLTGVDFQLVTQQDST